RPREAADGMIAATFRHMASRNNDPQLRTHAVLANMTRNRDGAWRSVEPTLLRRNRRVFGAWYRNDLARRLRNLGYDLTPTTVGGLPSFEISGWSQDWLEAFSTRRQDILQHMADEGRTYTTANAQAAALVTRGRKAEPVRGELVKLWHRRAEALGLTEERQSGMVPTDAARLTPLEAVWQAMQHLEERHSVFRRTDLLAAALGRDPGRHRHEELEVAIDRLRRDRHLVDTVRGDLTTRETLRAERRVIAALREGLGRSAPLTEEKDVTARLEATTLTEGQRDAVRTILLSESRIVGVQGFAGTGKTYMLKEVVRLAGGRPVIGLAPSSAAARVLALEAGIGTTTLQWMLARYGHLSDGPEDAPRLEAARARFRGAVIVVDEASMIGTVQMRDLQRVAERLGVARLALVGDRLQLRSVEAGQPFRLMQDAGMETARMDDVLRQRGPDLKAAVTHMIAGDADLAVQSLGSDVREIPPDRLAETAARLWLALPPEARQRTMILAPTHTQREEINAVLRKGLAEDGQLTGPTLRIERLVDRRLTRVLAADPLSYRAGDIVVANRDVYRCLEGEAWRVTGSSEDRIALERRGVAGGFKPSGNAAHNVSVFETRPIDLRTGEEIVFTRNLKSLGVVNGERGRIEEIGRTRLRIRLTDGRWLEPRRDDDRLRHIDHAWTSTVHRAQGMTTDNVIAVLDADSMMTDRALLYVEMSRARDGFLLLTDDTEQLVHRLEQETGVAHSALEATGQVLHVAQYDRVSRKEALRPVLEDWRALTVDAERRGIAPFLMPEANALLERLRRRAVREGQDAPEAITRILSDHEAHMRGEEADAIGAAWQSLRARAAKQGRSLAVQPGVDALLTRTAGMHSEGPGSEALQRALTEGVRMCRDVLRAFGERFETAGARVLQAARERDGAIAGIERDWQAQRIKETSQGDHIAFLPGTEGLIARTRAFAERYPGLLPERIAGDLTNCETLRQRWRRFLRIARQLDGFKKMMGVPGPFICRTMLEAEELLTDERISQKATLERLREPMIATLNALDERRAVEDLVQELRKDRAALEAEAARRGCHVFHVDGYGRFMERVSDFAHYMPDDLSAMLADQPKLQAADRKLREGLDAVVAFDARRRKIIKRAANRRPDTPLDRSLLTSYGRWVRAAPTWIAWARDMEGHALCRPEDRPRLERAIRRITDTVDGCGLEARHLWAFEEVCDKAEAEGCHRFFVEGYDSFYNGLGTRTIVGPGSNTLAVRERAVRDDMQYARAAVQSIEGDLVKVLQEREHGGDRFVAEMHPYYRWHRDAVKELESAGHILRDTERYGPHLARVPRLERRLRETAAALSERIRQDAPVRKEVEAAYETRMAQERAVRERSRARGRGRGPSRSLGLDLW
ncbi:MAG: AAA family ATPase, partial [Rhodospirillaceae bacterium]|nr:AAA family ATPase [Rhodospirillaceae bacterium]